MNTKTFNSLGLLVFLALLLSSCHKLPDHARYIPKDALVVVGIHTDHIGKKVAWDAVTGGNLLEELKKMGAGEQVPAAMNDIEQSGLNFKSTLYAYTKPDARFEGGMRTAAVLPVSDAGRLTEYFKKHFPQAAITEKQGRKELCVENEVFVSWNDDVLMAMNPIVSKVTHHDEAPEGDSSSAYDMPDFTRSWTETKPDAAATSLELDALFKPAKGDGVDAQKRFSEMEKEGHDITLWMNYSAIMDMWAANADNAPGMDMMSMTMGNLLLKGAGMSVGMDFEKGQIDGVMRYFSSDSLRLVAREFGKTNIDGDMLRRLPASQLNMAAGYHLSPAAIKMLLDKTGLSGMANLALMSKGMSMEDILGGFTGDFVMAMNNFRIEQQRQEGDSLAAAEYGLTVYPANVPRMDFVVAMKIGDKAKLMKLVNFISEGNVLQPVAPNTYRLAGEKGATMVIGDKYIAMSSSVDEANAFLRERAGAMPDAVHKEISGHPIGTWVDIKSLVAGASRMNRQSPSDSAALAAVRDALTTFSMQGGEYKEQANEYHMTLRFSDTGESSLLQLIRMLKRLSPQNAPQQAAPPNA